MKTPINSVPLDILFRRLLAMACLLSPVPGRSADAAAPDLARAVRVGDATQWRALLALKPDVNVRDAAGNTPLHFAALNHDTDAVGALLAAGAEVNAQNTAEATPLLYGAGDAEIVRVLLMGGANPNAASELKSSPLLAAVVRPDAYEAVRLLVEAGADVHATRGTEGVLERAVLGGDRRVIDLLLKRLMPAAAVSDALAAATGEGDEGLVRLFLEQGGDPNRDDGFVGHALNAALFSGHTEIARLLIERKSEFNFRSARGHGTPPMVWAAYNQNGDAAVAKALVAAGVDVNSANDHGATALSYALRSGANTPLVTYLQSIGAKAPENLRSKALPQRPVPSTPAERAALAKVRIEPALELLRSSSMAFLDNKFVQRAACTSCHGQDLPSVAFDLARARGFQINDVSFGRQIARQVSRWSTRAEWARQMLSPLPGMPVTLAYGLFGLRAAGYPADEMTDSLVRYLLRTQKTDGHWSDPTVRPPMEEGALVATAWSALSVRDYAPAGYAGVATDSQQRSAQWLARQEPATHNEAVFQLLGLHWSGEVAARMTVSVERILRTQRPDGGWAQLPGLESDAWATGSALYALHEAGRMKATDAVYQRGVEFLLRTQFEDGSWWVRSRTWPFQPHFDGKFPHGRDQWISQGATAWAAIALLFTIEPLVPALPAPTAHDLIAIYQKSPGAQAVSLGDVPISPASAVATIDFVRDIQPLLKRSCADCHGGDKPRAAFTLATRDTMLKGGASGEPSIAPGSADDSLLVKYVSGKIEDLEMPPLDRREKYPALSAAEIQLVHTWIDAGASWTLAKTDAAPDALGVTRQP